MNIDIALRITGDTAHMAVYADGEKKAITPQAFKRTGLTIDTVVKDVTVRWAGETQHQVAYKALHLVLKYLAPFQQGDNVIRVLTNNSTISKQLNDEWEVKAESLKPLHGAVKQLIGKTKVRSINAERLVRAFSDQ